MTTFNPEEFSTLIDEAVVEEPRPARKGAVTAAASTPTEEEAKAVELTKDEYEESCRWERKIRKLNKLFPNLKISEDERFEQITGQHPETLENLYKEWYTIMEEKNNKPMMMVAYETISRILETFMTNSMNIDIRGMTAENIRNPDIIKQLKLLELEYDIGDIIPVSDPTLALCISTLTGALMVYELNKKEKAEKELAKTDTVQSE